MKKSEDYLAHSFREVDAGDINKMMRCLTFMDGLPAFREYKDTILRKLNAVNGATVADLGCGLGFDIRRLAALVGATGKAIGVDTSRIFLNHARAAGKDSTAACFLLADIQRLPFANTSLDACKVDRTLQHVKEPCAVLHEIFRTLRPGGVIVCSEPDWGTFTIEDPSPIAGKVEEIFYQGFRHPRIGRELGSLMEAAGYVGMEKQDVLLATPGFASSDIVFDLTQTASRLASSSSSDEPLAWLANLRQREDSVCCSVSLTIQCARRP